MDTGTLLMGLLFSSIGLGYFLYGKKRMHLVARYCGVALMVYPYFIDNKWLVLLTGIVLMVLPKIVEV